MTDSESADDTKSWPTPFALDSADTRPPGTTSGRRRLSEVGDGTATKEPDDTSAWDRPTGRGRRLPRAPRYLKAGPPGSGGGTTGPSVEGGSSRVRSGDDPAPPPIESGPQGASSTDLGAPPPAAVPVPRPAAPPPMAGPPMPSRPLASNRTVTPAPAPAPSVAAPSVATASDPTPPGDAVSGPVAPPALPSESVPSKSVPSESVLPESVSSRAAPSDLVPTVSVPPEPDADAVAPGGGLLRRTRRKPDLSGLQEMRSGSDDGRTPDWMARRIVESEAPGSAYELGKQRRWRRRKITVLRSRTNRRLVRRIDTWTVFKVSLMFYLLMLIIVLVAGVATWNVAQHLGFVNDIQKSVRSLADDKTFVFRGKDALRWSAVGGAALGLLGTLFNTVAAMLYNLLSDVIGGLQVIVVTEPD